MIPLPAITTAYQKLSFWLKKTIALQSIQQLTLLFLVAFSVGFIIKSLVRDMLTVGYDDYQLASAPTIDLNHVEKNLINNGGSIATREPLPKGETCSPPQD